MAKPLEICGLGGADDTALTVTAVKGEVYASLKYQAWESAGYGAGERPVDVEAEFSMTPEQAKRLREWLEANGY